MRMAEPLQQATGFDRDSLVEQHRSYVRAIALKILAKLPPQIELDELVACGYLGLVKAAERYDPRRGVAFSTFSYYYIRGAIFDEIRKMGHLSRGDYARTKALANADDLAQGAVEERASNRPKSDLDHDIAQVEVEIESLIPAYLLSLNDIPPNAERDTRASFAETYEKEELLACMARLVAELPAEDRQLIEQIYYHNRSASDVAQELGLSRSWMSRLHARAIQRLRDLMRRNGVLSASEERR